MKKLGNFKVTAILVVFALCAVPIYAQPGQGQRPGQGQGQGQGQRPGQGQGQSRMMTEEAAKERVARLADTLQLSDAQEKKLMDYEVEQFRATQKARENFTEGDREAMREYMIKQRDLREAKYKEVLTPKQMEQYNKMMEARRQQRQPQQEEGDRPSRGRGR